MNIPVIGEDTEAKVLGPVVDGLPRWISLGTVGVLLLVVGITWEQRRRDVAAAERYLASLR